MSLRLYSILSIWMLASCCTAKHSLNSTWVFTKYPILKTPITVYIGKFTYSSQLLPVIVANNYLSNEIGCDLFTIVDSPYSADVVIEDHQKVDLLTGEFLLPPSKKGKTVLGDTSVRRKEGRVIYTIRIFSQDEIERQARLMAHELLHVLKVGHDDSNGSIMNPELLKDRDIVILPNVVETLRRAHCQAI